MKTTELIQELEKLIEKNGDADFHIYKSYSKSTETVDIGQIFYDDGEKDICIGVYA